MTDQSLIVDASFETLKKVYRVVFESNGGSFVEAADQIEEGSLLAKPADPTRKMSSFIGWFEDEALSVPFDFAHRTITSNMKLYAGWSDISYQLTISKDTCEMKAGESIQLNASVRSEDTFVPDLIWSSSDKTVASVDANGKVLAVGTGEADITVSIDGRESAKAICHVTVTKTPQILSGTTAYSRSKADGNFDLDIIRLSVIDLQIKLILITR